ncbi:hypothetical protein LTR39_006473, partial [Cryomyces antarcticus]
CFSKFENSRAAETFAQTLFQTSDLSGKHIRPGAEIRRNEPAPEEYVAHARVPLSSLDGVGFTHVAPVGRPMSKPRSKKTWKDNC